MDPLIEQRRQFIFRVLRDAAVAVYREAPGTFNVFEIDQVGNLIFEKIINDEKNGITQQERADLMWLFAGYADIFFPSPEDDKIDEAGIMRQNAAAYKTMGLIIDAAKRLGVVKGMFDDHHAVDRLESYILFSGSFGPLTDEMKDNIAELADCYRQSICAAMGDVDYWEA
jgi:hypothetical protein